MWWNSRALGVWFRGCGEGVLFSRSGHNLAFATHRQGSAGVVARRGLDPSDESQSSIE